MRLDKCVFGGSVVKEDVYPATADHISDPASRLPFFSCGPTGGFGAKDGLLRIEATFGPGRARRAASGVPRALVGKKTGAPKRDQVAARGGCEPAFGQLQCSWAQPRLSLVAIIVHFPPGGLQHVQKEVR